MLKVVILIGGPMKGMRSDSVHVCMFWRCRKQYLLVKLMLACFRIILSSTGTRFRPLSLELPKPLFPIAGFPIVHHHIEACKGVSWVNNYFNPFTPESDQSQISPLASQEIWHHTVWRTWLFIAYSDEKWLYYKFSLHHSYNRFLKGWENTLFELRSERVNTKRDAPGPAFLGSSRDSCVLWVKISIVFMFFSSRIIFFSRRCTVYQLKLRIVSEVNRNWCNLKGSTQTFSITSGSGFFSTFAVGRPSCYRNGQTSVNKSARLSPKPSDSDPFHIPPGHPEN